MLLTNCRRDSQWWMISSWDTSPCGMERRTGISSYSWSPGYVWCHLLVYIRRTFYFYSISVYFLDPGLPISLKEEVTLPESRRYFGRQYLECTTSCSWEECCPLLKTLTVIGCTMKNILSYFVELFHLFHHLFSMDPIPLSVLFCPSFFRILIFCFSLSHFLYIICFKLSVFKISL